MVIPLCQKSNLLLASSFLGVLPGSDLLLDEPSYFVPHGIPRSLGILPTLRFSGVS